jgi:hypothetical protein
LNALTGPSEHVVGDRRLNRGFAHGRQRRLQRPDGVIECQSVRLEDFRGIASCIADDGGEHDGAVDIAPAASACRGCGRLQDAPHVLRDAERVLRVRRWLGTLQDTRDDIGFEALAVDMARIEHGDGVGVVAESREQMLKRHFSGARRPGEVGAPCQRRGEIRRHRNLGNICGRHAHDVSSNEGQDGQDWP